MNTTTTGSTRPGRRLAVFTLAGLLLMGAAGLPGDDAQWSCTVADPAVTR